MNLRSLFFTALLLTACAGGTTATTLNPTTSEPASTSPSEATTTTVAATTTMAVPSTTAPPVIIRVENGVKVEGPDTVSVAEGEMVSFQVLADVVDEVHVHGYDLFFDTIAGEPITIEFVADATGIFEAELEGSHLPLVNVEVTP